MSVDELQDYEDDSQEYLDEFIQILKDQFGGNAGNKSLREHLINECEWSEEDYWETHGWAVDRGLVVKGRGKGGSVSLSQQNEEGSPQTSNQTVQQVRISEVDLYEPALKVIRNSWVKLYSYDESASAITALRGRANTGGKWTRPDVSVLAVRAFPYLPGRYFDIITFEIKPPDDISVEGVFEALSHQQFATKSYVIYNVTDDDLANDFSNDEKAGARIMETARRHGVGVIVANKIEDYDYWEELNTPKRVSPDPEQANRFIATGFDQDIRDKIIKWHK